MHLFRSYCAKAQAKPPLCLSLLAIAGIKFKQIWNPPYECMRSKCLWKSAFLLIGLQGMRFFTSSLAVFPCNWDYGVHDEQNGMEEDALIACIIRWFSWSIYALSGRSREASDVSIARGKQWVHRMKWSVVRKERDNLYCRRVKDWSGNPFVFTKDCSVKPDPQGNSPYHPFSITINQVQIVKTITHIKAIRQMCCFPLFQFRILLASLVLFIIPCGT